MEITICQPDPLLETNTQLNSISKSRSLIEHSGTLSSIKYIEEKYKSVLKRRTISKKPTLRHKRYLEKLGLWNKDLNRSECIALISKQEMLNKMDNPRYRLAVIKAMHAIKTPIKRNSKKYSELTFF